MMTAVATIIAVIMLVLQELLPTIGLSNIGPLPWGMYQEEEEVMLEQFILYSTYFVWKYCF